MHIIPFILHDVRIYRKDLSHIYKPTLQFITYTTKYYTICIVELPESVHLSTKYQKQKKKKDKEKTFLNFSKHQTCDYDDFAFSLAYYTTELYVCPVTV